MNTASNSVTPVAVTTAMDLRVYGADEPMARKTERAEASFVETIVGRSAGIADTWCGEVAVFANAAIHLGEFEREFDNLAFNGLIVTQKN